MCYTPAVKIFDTILQAWIACTCTHLRNFLTYFSFILYDIMFSMKKSKRGSYSYGSQSVSTPNLYVVSLLYHPFCISPGSQQLRLYNRHAPLLVVCTVYSACVSWSVEWKDTDFNLFMQFKVCRSMVRSPHLWLSCRHPVFVYTTIGVIALQWSPTVVGATLAHLYSVNMPFL